MPLLGMFFLGVMCVTFSLAFYSILIAKSFEQSLVESESRPLLLFVVTIIVAFAIWCIIPIGPITFIKIAALSVGMLVVYVFVYLSRQ